MRNIYIVLTQTNTLFSRTIKAYTGDKYNHASISFEKDLKEMYSFGRKHRYNLLNSGFVKESLNKGLFELRPNADCCVIKKKVTDEEYYKMIRSLEIFKSNQEVYSYNIVGIIGFILGLELNRQYHFFCSQFVAYVLNQSNFWHSRAAKTKPIDFMRIENKEIVFEGRLGELKKMLFIENHLAVNAF